MKNAAWTGQTGKVGTPLTHVSWRLGGLTEHFVCWPVERERWPERERGREKKRESGRGENERGRCEETEGGKNVNATFHNLANSVMDLSANACSSDNSCTLH